MALFRGDGIALFYRAMGWGRVGYDQEPIHVFNDQYTARPMAQPFDRAWQGFQKRQEEAFMDTTWLTVPKRNSYQTDQSKTARFQQDGSFHQIRGAWGPVPATDVMTAQSVTPEKQGLLADFVRAVKRTWTVAPNG